MNEMPTNTKTSFVHWPQTNEANNREEANKVLTNAQSTTVQNGK